MKSDHGVMVNKLDYNIEVSEFQRGHILFSFRQYQPYKYHS